MSHRSFEMALGCALRSLAAGTAHAQLNPDSVVRQVSRDVDRYTGIELVEHGGNGHDKCKGKGHGGSNGGSGHDDGECEEGEGETPPGPVASEVCNVAAMSPESSWSRYSCTFATYNENYVAGTVEANESYPETLQEYAAETSAQLAAAATTFLGGVEEALPGTGGPIPIGPGVAEGMLLAETTLNYVERTATALSSGDVDQTAADTEAYLGGITSRYLPGTGGPIPIGPGVAEGLIATTVTYADSTTTALTRGDVDSFIVATDTLATSALDFGDQTLPGTGGPIPIGPGVRDAYETTFNSAYGVYGATTDFTDAAFRTLPGTGGPIPIGPGVKDYEIQMPSTGGF